MTVSFTWVDWAIIAIIVVSALISLTRGFVKEALSLVTWVLAGLVAWLFGGADRFLGMVFGAARGGLLVVVMVGLLCLAPVDGDTWWRESVMIPHFLLVADWSKNFILQLACR